MKLFVIFFLFFLLGFSSSEKVNNSVDSYVKAYTISKNQDSIKSENRRIIQNSGYEYPSTQYGAPFEPQNSYGPPSYEPQKIYEGPVFAPNKDYGPPPNHRPPAPIYGPPIAPIYGPPVYGPPSQNLPYGRLLESILDKFKFKLDLFTIGKIILKLVIFKKIVSFIAILCLLLFIPSLKNKTMVKPPPMDEDEEEYRSLSGLKNLEDGKKLVQKTL